jgi:ribosomal protein L29
MFQPQAVAPIAPTTIDTAAIEKQLAELSVVIAELQGKTDDDSRAKLRELERSYAELKAALGRGGAVVEKPIDADGTVKEAPVAPPVNKKQ